jgi:hypothetical protein
MLRILMRIKNGERNQPLFMKIHPPHCRRQPACAARPRRSATDKTRMARVTNPFFLFIQKILEVRGLRRS